MTPQTSISTYQGLFRDFAYAYAYWFSPMLQAFSPTMYFGCNIQDEGVEKHVLSQAGSYGYQINRIMDALTVLASRVDRAELTPAEARYIDRFEELAELADRTASEAQNKPRRGVTRADVDRMIDDILSLRTKYRDVYQELVKLTSERLDLEVDPQAGAAAAKRVSSPSAPY